MQAVCEGTGINGDRQGAAGLSAAADSEIDDLDAMWASIAASTPGRTPGTVPRRRPTPVRARLASTPELDAVQAKPRGEKREPQPVQPPQEPELPAARDPWRGGAVPVAAGGAPVVAGKATGSRSSSGASASLRSEDKDPRSVSPVVFRESDSSSDEATIAPQPPHQDAAFSPTLPTLGR